ncbi:MAG: putative Zn finger-like uncharacterized protein [Myxococcota bacterium]|jgi:predicted Zn finger-like uncharacterized protein
MQFQCPRCQARYKIADEKVRGRTLRVRCRTCSAQILLKSKAQPNVGAPAVEPQGPPRTVSVGPLRTVVPLTGGAVIPSPKLWHVAIGRDKTGPHTRDEVQHFIARGSLKPQSYVWRPGMANWAFLETIGEFRHALETCSPERSVTAPGKRNAEVSEPPPAAPAAPAAPTASAAPPSASPRTEDAPAVDDPFGATIADFRFDPSSAASKAALASDTAEPDQDAPRDTVISFYDPHGKAVASPDEAPTDEAPTDEAPTDEAERLAGELVATERAATDAATAERLAFEAAATERLAAEAAEAERLATEAAEAERLATEAAETERLAAEAAETQRLAAEAERLAAETAETQRLAAEAAESERLAAEAAESERLAAEAAESERFAAEAAESERFAAEAAESERFAAEAAETQRLAAEVAEAERLAAEQLAAARRAEEQFEAEFAALLAQEQADQLAASEEAMAPADSPAVAETPAAPVVAETPAAPAAEAASVEPELAVVEAAPESDNFEVVEGEPDDEAPTSESPADSVPADQSDSLAVAVPIADASGAEILTADSSGDPVLDLASDESVATAVSDVVGIVEPAAAPGPPPPPPIPKVAISAASLGLQAPESDYRGRVALGTPSESEDPVSDSAPKTGPERVETEGVETEGVETEGAVSNGATSSEPAADDDDAGMFSGVDSEVVTDHLEASAEHELGAEEADFFAAGEGAHQLDKPVSDSELNALTPVPAEETMFPSGKAMVELEIGVEPVVPSRGEVNDLVQEFSLMIRLNKKSSRSKLMMGLLLVVVIGVAVAAVWYLQESAADQPTYTRGSSTPEDVAPPPEEAAPTYRVVEKEAPVAGEAGTVARKTYRESLDMEAMAEPEKVAPESASPRSGTSKTVHRSTKRRATPRVDRASGLDSAKSSEEAAAMKRKMLNTGAGGKRETVLEAPTTPGPEKTGSAVSSDKINQLIGNKLRKFGRCKGSGVAPVKVKMAFTVLASGEVSAIGVSLPEGGSGSVASCVRRLAGQWRFPPTGKDKSFSRILLL